ncbi:MAG TPA: acetyl-CoA carboxylase biotin carboxyl carrier protein [Rhodospirillaceae bacterium]|nr:acetyl-CoA carboxylase biotin carboxyl carrier protein [Rhodospirillaceae bacterium]
MAKTSIDSELVRSLAALLDETHLNEIEYESAGLRIRVARNAQSHITYAAPGAPPPAITAAQEPGPTDWASHPGVVKSPMVGVTYMSPEPGLPPFIGLGDLVAEGQTLLLIEAMKTFNPIRAIRGGKVTAILVQDGQPVEFGEPLIVIE